MRLVFMGTPALAVPALDALSGTQEIVGVVTQPDRPAGRGGHLAAPPVKAWAGQRGIPVLQPEKARDLALLEQLRALNADVFVVLAFGQILPRALLDLPPRGCINLHYSLLPRWRGAAPVQHAILHGDAVTGLTTQWMAERLDAGDIIMQQQVPIEPDETSGELLQRLAALGARLLGETLGLVEQGLASRRPQDEAGVTFAPTLKKADARLCWTDGAPAIVRAVRAYNPWPVVWLPWQDQELKVWRAETSEPAGSEPGQVVRVEHDEVVVSTGSGLLHLLEVQQSGRARMNAGAWARGTHIEPGRILQ